ncbi:membrane protein [Limosilactobacillus reuteri]|uniref:Membrane protein n=1 Tax=Limosilactobacillus reuteri TaxID=1598 RepID=A0A2S1ET84_LIMRT|nr:membrane protein [Limosilactobacillus reuteri]
MMENRVSNSKANATYQNSSKVKEVAYRIFAAVANAIFGRSRRRTINPNNW